MDSEGYLPVNLIASFHRVQSLTSHLPLVLEAIKDSDKLELSGFKVRTTVDPLRWPIIDKEIDKVSNPLGVPPPPTPYNFRDLHSENLNPDVAPFIPNEKGKFFF